MYFEAAHARHIHGRCLGGNTLLSERHPDEKILVLGKG